MDKKIIEYIKNNRVLTFATSVNNQPYCANCFYVFDDENITLIFLSDDSSRHIIEAKQNIQVAGTILSDISTIAKIQGVQFTGVFIKPDEIKAKDFYDKYYKKYPFAIAKPSPVWGIEVLTIKMTDNTLGFGKKIVWSK